MSKRPLDISPAEGDIEEDPLVVGSSEILELLTVETMKKLVRKYKLGRIDSRKDELKQFISNASQISIQELRDELESQFFNKRKRTKELRESTSKNLAKYKVGDRVYWNEQVSGADYRFGIITKISTKSLYVDEYCAQVLKCHSTASESSSLTVPNWTMMKSSMVRLPAYLPKLFTTSPDMHFSNITYL